METLKRAALMGLGIIAIGFMPFSFATIGLAVLGFTAVLLAVNPSYTLLFTFPALAKSESLAIAGRKQNPAASARETAAMQ